MHISFFISQLVKFEPVPSVRSSALCCAAHGDVFYIGNTTPTTTQPHLAGHALPTSTHRWITSSTAANCSDSAHVVRVNPGSSYPHPVHIWPSHCCVPACTSSLVLLQEGGGQGGVVTLLSPRLAQNRGGSQYR